MYRVKFTRNGENTVDTGEAILNAGSADQAIDITAQMCNLPKTATQFDVSRAKPQFVLLRRSNAERRIATYDAMTVPDRLASAATFPHDPTLPERENFAVQVRTEVRATSETDAIQSAARAMSRHAQGERHSRSTLDFELSCEKVTQEARVSRFEENAGLTAQRFFQGGAVRPR